MYVDDLKKFGYKTKWINKIKQFGIESLYDYQKEILEKNLLEGNLILSAPTASGKTLIAILKMIKTLEKKRKVVYIVPLVSLGLEKYSELKKFFDKDYSVALSMGDFDSTDPWLKDYDVIVVTVEKMESLLRHRIDWIDQIGLIVADEIHLLNDPSRGPTLEVVLVKLSKMLKNVDVLGLSATISNSKELSNWLNAKLYETNFRPVKLYQGVAYENKIYFLDREGYELGEGKIEEEIVKNTLDMKKQLLFFVPTRKESESWAEKLSKIVSKKISKATKFQLNQLSKNVLTVLETPTRQCEKLAKCVSNGVAFHHAGLLGKQRSIVEEGFRKGLIKVIVATPTLSAGVNLPAFRVVIKSTRRYYPGLGSAYIPVLEYHQMVGRAGRPQYDKWGESILVARSKSEADVLTDRYILSDPEPITSKLSSESVLRMSVLSLIATNFCNSFDSLLNFFNSTFFAYHYGDVSLIEEKIIDVTNDLESWNFVKIVKNKIHPTQLGKRVSELYIDPLTAHNFVIGLKRNRKTIFGYLNLISFSSEMKPLPNVSQKEIEKIEEKIEVEHQNFLVEVPNYYDLEYEDFSKSVKLAMIFEEWINETTEEQILEKYKITPGELYSRLKIADWLLYSLKELARIEKMSNVSNFVNKIRFRLKYGVKEELLPLVRIEGIGRIRARKLYNVKIRTITDLKKIPIETLSVILGPKTAKKVKSVVEGKKHKREKQKTLV